MPAATVATAAASSSSVAAAASAAAAAAVAEGSPEGSGEEVQQQRRRRRRKAAKPAQEDGQKQQWGVMPEVSEEVWEQRILHRRKVLTTLEARLLRLTRIAPQAADGGSEVLPKEQTLGPMLDPEDRSVSRRQWRKAIDEWFKTSLLQCECNNSVASTEECISTHCGDGESEGSDES